MMKKNLSIIVILILVAGAGFLIASNIFQSSGPVEKNTQNKTGKSGFKVNPISHASVVIEWSGKVFYFDPVGKVKSFKKYGSPDIVFVTHSHPDHFNKKVLGSVVTSSTRLIVPKKVMNKLPDKFSGRVTVMSNGETTSRNGFKIKAMPMYNLPQSKDAYHVKGEGNGYLVEKDNRKVYIAGDTSGIEAMRNLKKVDLAFVPMNQPYTMGVEEAADAVLDFAPKVVYPYHYRNKNGSLSNVKKFKKLVNKKDEQIKVKLRDWYPAIN
ncbi:MAG: MBL fold metallo-hydrolase [Candidatus Magasanikbacteria bacterium]